MKKYVKADKTSSPIDGRTARYANDVMIKDAGGKSTILYEFAPDDPFVKEQKLIMDSKSITPGMNWYYYPETQRKNRVVSVAFDVLMPANQSPQDNEKFMKLLQKACKDCGYECLTDSPWNMNIEDLTDTGYYDDYLDD